MPQDSQMMSVPIIKPSSWQLKPLSYRWIILAKEDSINETHLQEDCHNHFSHVSKQRSVEQSSPWASHQAWHNSSSHLYDVTYVWRHIVRHHWTIYCHQSPRARWFAKPQPKCCSQNFKQDHISLKNKFCSRFKYFWKLVPVRLKNSFPLKLTRVEYLSARVSCDRIKTENLPI